MALLTVPMVICNDTQDDDAEEYDFPITYVDGSDDGGGIEVNYYWG